MILPNNSNERLSYRLSATLVKEVYNAAEKHTALESVAWKDVHILYNEENLPTATLLYKLQLKC